MKRASALLLVTAMVPASAAAHAAHEQPSGPDLWLVLIIGAPALAYCIGLARLWRSAGVGRGARLGRVAAFLLGWAAAVMAFISPLHTLAERSFFGHMLVHTILIAMAAPLLVLSRPLAAFTWALRRRARLRLFHSRRMRRLLAWAKQAAAPVLATVIQIVVLSIWHLPAIFDLAVRHRALHVLQHLTFVAASLLFWWAMIEGRRAADGTAVMCLFVTSIFGTLLGALLTLASNPWYAAPRDGDIAFDLSPLQDQQLGGLVMWVPAGLTYVAAALILLARWVSNASRSGKFQPSSQLPSLE